MLYLSALQTEGETFVCQPFVNDLAHIRYLSSPLTYISISTFILIKAQLMFKAFCGQ